MTTWYVDLVSGTDATASAGNGDSFATRRKKISNVTSGVLAAGDTIKVMQSPAASSLGVNGTWGCPSSQYAKLSASNINISSSTNATPIVITSSGAHGFLTGEVVHIAGHSTNTNANGTWKITSITSTTFSLQDLFGNNSVGNGTGGATGSVYYAPGQAVLLASAVTKNVACHGAQGVQTNWTASANVTCTLDATYTKTDVQSQAISIASGFTTGKIAYVALGSSVDFSAYQQISLMLIRASGTISASQMQFCLCSDTTGDTVVDTLQFPAISLGNWYPIVMDKGSALGSAIQSVAIYSTADFGAAVINIANVIACKSVGSADSLTHKSLIGKNSSGDNGGWYPIQSILGPYVLLGAKDNISSHITSLGAYFGTNETVTTYKREPIDSPMGANANHVATVKAGTAVNPINISGGWNSTDMTTQVGDTVISGINMAYGQGIVFGHDYNSISKISLTKVNTPISLGNTANHFSTLSECSLYGTNAVFSGSQGPSATNTIQLDYVLNCQSIGSFQSANRVTIGRYWGSDNQTTLSPYGATLTFTSAKGCKSVGSYMFQFSGACTIIDSAFQYCYQVALINAPVTFRNCTFSDTPQPALSTYQTTNMIDCAVNSSTEFTIPINMPGSFYSHNHDQTAGNHYFYCPRGTAQTSNSIGRHTMSGLSWKVSVIDNTLYTSSSTPMSFPVAKVPVGSGNITAKLWVSRSSTNLSARLMCKGREIGGITNDTSVAMTAAGHRTPSSITRSGSTATVTFNGHGYSTGQTVEIRGANQSEYNVTTTITVVDANTFTYTVSGTPATPATGTLVLATWEQLSLALSPSEVGVIPLTLEAWSTTTSDYVYFDDLSVT